MTAQARIKKKGGEHAKTTRAMYSQINWAILGLLLKQPSYVYLMTQQFEDHYGDALPISGSSHVYAVFKQLERRGLIEKVPGARGTMYGTDRRKIIYRVTEGGVQSYREYVFAMAENERRQSRLFALMLATFEHDPAMGLQILDHHERGYLREARRSRDPSVERATASSSSTLADLLLSEERRLTAGAKLPWVEFARTKFRALLAGS